MKCVGPDLRQTGTAASAALPAVTRNTGRRCEYSDKVMSLYYEI